MKIAKKNFIVSYFKIFLGFFNKLEFRLSKSDLFMSLFSVIYLLAKFSKIV